MQAKFSLLLALVTAATAIPTRLDLDSDAFNVTRRAPSSSKKVIVQMFGWNWDSIASECRNFLGPEGYGFVQGSPLNIAPAFVLWLTGFFIFSEPTI